MHKFYLEFLAFVLFFNILRAYHDIVHEVFIISYLGQN